MTLGHHHHKKRPSTFSAGGFFCSIPPPSAFCSLLFFTPPSSTLLFVYSSLFCSSPFYSTPTLPFSTLLSLLFSTCTTLTLQSRACLGQRSCEFLTGPLYRDPDLDQRSCAENLWNLVSSSRLHPHKSCGFPSRILVHGSCRFKDVV